MSLYEMRVETVHDTGMSQPSDCRAPGFEERARIAKDSAAGTVLALAAGSVLAFAAIAVPRLGELPRVLRAPPVAGALAAGLAACGIRLKMPPRAEEPGLALALGGAGITLTDLATLYVALANNGRVAPLQYLDSVIRDRERFGRIPGAALVRL